MELGERTISYINTRSDQISVIYLDVLQKQLDNARSQAEYSPVIVSRADFEIFIENAEDAKIKLRDETFRFLHEAYSGVLADHTSNLISSNNYLSDLIMRKIDDCMEELKLRGAQILTDNINILERADERWRMAHPDLAAAQLLD